MCSTINNKTINNIIINNIISEWNDNIPGSTLNLHKEIKNTSKGKKINSKFSEESIFVMT